MRVTAEFIVGDDVMGISVDVDHWVPDVHVYSAIGDQLRASVRERFPWPDVPQCGEDPPADITIPRDAWAYTKPIPGMAGQT